MRKCRFAFQVRVDWQLHFGSLSPNLNSSLIYAVPMTHMVFEAVKESYIIVGEMTE